MGKSLFCILVGMFCLNFIPCDYSYNNMNEAEPNYEAIIAIQKGDDEFLKEKLSFITRNTTLSEFKEYLGEPDYDMSTMAVSSYSGWNFKIENGITEYTISVKATNEVVFDLNVSTYRNDGTEDYIRLKDSKDEFITERFGFLKKDMTLSEFKQHIGEPVKIDTSAEWLTIYTFSIVNGEVNYSVTAHVLNNSVVFVRIEANINVAPQKPIIWGETDKVINISENFMQ